MPIIKITIPSFETSEAQVNENKSNNYQKKQFLMAKVDIYQFTDASKKLNLQQR